MGAKGSKPEEKPETIKPEYREVVLNNKTLIDTQDPYLFPKEVSMEFQNIFNHMALNNQSFRTVLLDECSQLKKWIKDAPKYHNTSYTIVQEGGVEENALAKALLRTTRTIRRSNNNNNNKRRNPVKYVQPKEKFLYRLSSMCHPTPIKIDYLVTQLEDPSNPIVLALASPRFIAGFSILSEIKGMKKSCLQNKNQTRNNGECLHRHITCTGPRGKGMGKALVNTIHQIASDFNYPCVTLEASGSEGFHEKQGYRKKNEKNTSESPLMIYKIQKGGKRKTRKHRK